MELQVVVASGSLAQAEPVEPQMRRRLDHVEAAALQAERAGPRPPRIRPILAAGTGAAVGLHVRAAGRMAPGGGIVFPQNTFEQDLSALQKAAELPQDYASPMVFLDVGFDTFLSRSKTEAYVAACTRIPQAMRQNLVFLLSALPHGVTVSLLQDVLRRLKLFGGGTGCYLGELAPPPADLRLVPLSIIAVEAALWRQAEGGVQDRFRRLASVLQVHHARLIALDVPQPSSHGLAEAGATYITPPAEEPH
jgi:hypothetical protein